MDNLISKKKILKFYQNAQYILKVQQKNTTSNNNIEIFHEVDISFFFFQEILDPNLLTTIKMFEKSLLQYKLHKIPSDVAENTKLIMLDVEFRHNLDYQNLFPMSINQISTLHPSKIKLNRLLIHHGLHRPPVINQKLHALA